MARTKNKPKHLAPILKETKLKPETVIIDSSEDEEMSEDQDMNTSKADNRSHGGKNSRDDSSISSSSSSESSYGSTDYSTEESVSDKRRIKMKTVVVKRQISVPKHCSKRRQRDIIASDLKCTSR